MRFDYHISHVPGKHLYAAGGLSRASTLPNSDEDATKFQEGVE